MDLDQDGITDLISGSWPGELFFFKGTGKGEYEDSVKLKHENGEIINVGGSIETASDGSITITGDAEFKVDEKTGRSYVVYNGKDYGRETNVSLGVTGCATHVHAVDWDIDGDLDLLVGDIHGQLYLIPHLGNMKFGPQEKLSISIGGDAGPTCVDWDADGLFDIVAGDDSGAVTLFRNEGVSGKPKFEERKELIPKLSGSRWGTAPAEVKRGGRTKVCVTDWNADGRLDLLVGDCTYQKAKPIERTPAKQKEFEQAKAELHEVRGNLGEIYRKFRGPNRVTDPTELEKLQLKMAPLRSRVTELSKLVPSETETHGWIWYFEQH